MPFRTDAGEPRALDTDLGRRLGFAKPANIRDLIKRLRADLERFGPLAEVDLDRYGRPVSGSARCGTSPGQVPHGGEPDGASAFRGFLLTYEQALVVAIASDAPRAPEVRHEVVAGYMAWQRERAGIASPVQNPEPPAELFADVLPGTRLSDFDLGKRLGFKRPRDVRSIMGRYTKEMMALGEIVEVPSPHGIPGRPTTIIHLNREQCLLMGIVSLVPAAVAARHHAVKALAGSAAPMAPAALPDSLAAEMAGLRGMLRRQADQIEAMAASRAIKVPGQHRRGLHLRDMQEADAVDLFLAGCVVAKRGAVIQARTLYLAWCEFARTAAVPANSMNWLATQMNARGHQKRKSSIIWYLDLQLLEKSAWTAGAVLHVEGGAA